MPFSLRLAILMIALILMFTIIVILKKDLIPIKFSLLWWIVIIILLFLSLYPKFLLSFVNLLGFKTTSNMVTGVFFVILLFITISLTVIISNQKKKINLLIQEVSLLKSKVNRLEK